jgi:hypothetical protein
MKCTMVMPRRYFLSAMALQPWVASCLDELVAPEYDPGDFYEDAAEYCLYA